MAIKARRVAVIGTGPAGAIATDALFKEQAFDTIRVFERQSGVGGTWVPTPHLPAGVPSLGNIIAGTADSAVSILERLPAVTPLTDSINNHQKRFSDSALHENLHTNIIPELMSYTQEPFPTDLSERALAEYGPHAPYRHHTAIRGWIENIFSRVGYENFLELNTTVEKVEKVQAEWVLTLRKESSARNYWWRESFDAVVVASGHYNVPWIPEIPGLVDFEQKYPGTILHSKHYRDPSKFKGKRVVVMGGSVSSHEVVHEILDVAQHPVYASIRGEPLAALGWDPFLHPHIAIKKGIIRFDAETKRVIFSDETSLSDVDFVIFGTGYTFSLPYIPHVQERIKNAYRRLPGVYQHTWDIEDPTLTFIGMLGGGFTFRVYEWQAVAIARHLAGRAKALPSVAEQLEWERQRVAVRKGGKEYYSIAPDYEGFFNLFKDIAGDPAPGTTGRTLPPFDRKWLEIWSGMAATKNGAFRRKRKRAEEGLAVWKAKL